MQENNWLGTSWSALRGPGRLSRQSRPEHLSRCARLWGPGSGRGRRSWAESERRIRTMMTSSRPSGRPGRAVPGHSEPSRHPASRTPAPLQPGNLVLRRASDTERASIWKIQTKRFGLECATCPTTPAGWAATSAIAARRRYMLRASLKEAAQWITLVGARRGPTSSVSASWRRTWLPQRQPAGRLPSASGKPMAEPSSCERSNHAVYQVNTVSVEFPGRELALLQRQHRPGLLVVDGGSLVARGPRSQRRHHRHVAPTQGDLPRRERGRREQSCASTTAGRLWAMPPSTSAGKKL